MAIADNDDSGRKHVQGMAADLYGKAASVKTLELPGLPEHGDVSDWLDRRPMVSARRLAASAPAWSPGPFRPLPSTNGNGNHLATDGGFRSYASLDGLSNEELGLVRARRSR